MQPNPKHTSNLLCPLSSLLHTRRGKSFVTNEISQNPSEHSYAPVGLSILVAALILFTLPSLQAQTHISGEVSGEWTREESPYFIDTLAVVPEGETLIIEPEVEIELGVHWVNDWVAYDTMRISGNLIAVGTEEDSIRFVRGGEDIFCGILEISSNADQDSSIISHCSIDIQIEVRTDRLLIINSLITEYWMGGIHFLEAFDDDFRTTGLIQNCSFFRAGIGVVDASPIIRLSLFEYGYISSSNSAEPTIESCHYIGSTTYSFRNGAQGHVRNCEFYGLSIKTERNQPDTEPLIENCRLVGIRTEGVGSTPTIRYCVLDGSGVSVIDGASPIVENNIIRANTALRIDDSFGNQSPGEMQFRNNILTRCNNGYKTEAGFYDPDELGIDYNILWEVVEPRVRINALGAHDRIIDPRFNEGFPRDLQLRPDSPAIDTGDPDLGQDPDGTRKDIGAYFFDQRIDHPPAMVSDFDFHTPSNDTMEYWAVAVDDGEDVTMEARMLPDWLEEVDRDQIVDSILIRGIPPENLYHDSFWLFAIDSEEQVDSQQVWITIDYTLLEGMLSGTLTLDDSPYVVIDHIRIDEGDTLVIEPGVEIRFNERDAFFYDTHIDFIVYGVLISEGTEEDSIRFTSNQPIPRPGDWGGIRIYGEESEGTSFFYTTIEYGGAWVIEPTNTEFEINHCLIKDCRSGPVINESQFRIENSIFKCDRGFSLDAKGTGTIRNCIITGDVGGLSFGCGSPDDLTIEGNLIILNGLFNGREIPTAAVDGVSGTLRNNIIMQNGFQRNGNPNRGVDIMFVSQQDPWSDSLVIENNLFTDNSNGIMLVTVRRCSFNNNTIANNGHGVTFSSWNLFARNNIIANNRGIGWSESGQIINMNADYNLIWGNIGSNYDLDGDIPEHDISEDPLFFGIDPFSYRLTSNSPGVDAGDPNIGEDPDGTRKDLGYHHYNQNNHSPVIRDYQPGDTVIAIQGIPVLFSVEVMDEDEEDSLVYRWFSGLEKMGEESFVELAFADTGLARLICIVMDGYDADSTSWTVQIEPNSVEEDIIAPMTYELHNSYPNPFNVQAVVPFQLPEATSVEFTLFNTNGRLVKNLSRRRFKAGYHRLILDANSLSSGVYILRMKSERYNGSIRMILLK